jgi:hypothetical protein
MTISKWVLLAGLLSATALFGAAGKLEIYWIDAEGGAATKQA